MNMPDPNEETHKCSALSCDSQIPLKRLMCYRHWWMLPHELRRQIWKEYRPGQEKEGVASASPAYLELVGQAVEFIREKESKAPQHAEAPSDAS
jgi:hypothetical protein